MILLIDCGNTRIKWGIVRGSVWLAEGALGHGEIATLGDIARQYPGLDGVLGANVAGPRVAEAITTALHALAPVPRWLQSSAECSGVRNLYDTPSQLGSDRWAALIGARSLHAGTCLVVTAGTATTVDILDAAGRFQGGLILPGEHLMRRALAGNTAQLPFAEGSFTLTPRNTADAIVSGCLNAQAGAIERMFRQISTHPDALCLLNGGGAGLLEPLLAVPYRRIDNLVLKGLAVVAGEEARP